MIDGGFNDRLDLNDWAKWSYVSASTPLLTTYYQRPITSNCPLVNTNLSLTLLMIDGGFKDRLGLNDWAKWSDATASTPRRAIVHLVGTSAKKVGRG